MNIELKEEYSDYLYNKVSDLSIENHKYMVDVFEDWVNDGNVEEFEDGYIEQTTQWRVFFTAKSLIDFYVMEYDVLGETCRNGKEWNRCNCC